MVHIEYPNIYIEIDKRDRKKKWFGDQRNKRSDKLMESFVPRYRTTVASRESALGLEGLLFCVAKV